MARTFTSLTRTVALTGASLILVAACGGGGASTAAPGGAATGAPAGTAGAGTLATGMAVTDVTKLCDLLGAGDFAVAGITGAGTVTANTDGPGTAYCVYSGESAGTGGIEFDIFVGADAADTYETILGEVGGDMQPITIPGVVKAVATEGTVGKPDAPASVVVQTSNLAFTIAAPAGEGVAARLATLAALVIARGVGLQG
jgi:hypothetical protein